jgi:hypothetical protein
MPLVLCVPVIFEIFALCLGWPGLQSSYMLGWHIGRMTTMCHHTQLLVEMESVDLFLGLAMNHNAPDVYLLSN